MLIKMYTSALLADIIKASRGLRVVDFYFYFKGIICVYTQLKITMISIGDTDF